MTLRDLRNTISHKLGLDKAIAFSSGARVIQAGAGAITVLFIASFLTGVEQGFYYTFGSVLALQVFFELGFTSVITQYVAHEAVYRDDPVHESRLAYLVRFCVKWYSVVAVAFWGSALIFLYDLFCKPLLSYRKLLNAAMNGKQAEDEPAAEPGTEPGGDAEKGTETDLK